MEDKNLMKIQEREGEDGEKSRSAGTADEKKSDSAKKTAGKKTQKQPRGRRRLYADYQYKEVKNKRGKSVRRKVYTGKHYGFAIPKEYKKNEAAFVHKIKLIYTGFFLAALLLWLLPSVAMESQALGHQVQNSAISFFYVLLPYVVCALPIMLMFLTLAEFIFTRGNKHEQGFMEALTKNLRGQTIMLMICAVITALAQICFIITNYKSIVSAATEVGVIAFMMILVGTCYFWLRKQESFPMKTL